MKRFLSITLIALLVAGCSSGVKQSWRDFNAYFNTFYNTKQFYETGLQQNQRQPAAVNPLVPIRVYGPPTRAGLQDFERAIDTGATILQNHPESSFVEPAVAIIGKSYFYRSEFFAALEKFQELQIIGDEDARQEAVFWQGRTFFELGNNAEGIRFLENEIGVIEEWEPSYLAQTQVILAQLHASNESWPIVIDLLVQAIPNLSERQVQDRAYFLLGQAYEWNGEFEAARTAYSSVRSSNPSYDLVFHSLRKQAEVLRRMGEYDQAMTTYSRMERDDKNIDSRAELQYEMGRTAQLQGNHQQAMAQFNNLLRNPRLNPTPTTKALTYYSMAELQRFDLGNFEMAAAYYDSAASERADRNRLPSGFNAAELAASFGEYTTVRREITEKDSLLYLGQLSQEDFDAAIAEIRQQRQIEIQEELDRRRRQQDQVVVVDQDQTAFVDAAAQTEFGFLNIRNPVMVADASLQFQGVWGDRPLVDNWRRRSEVTGSRREQLAGNGTNATQQQQAGEGQMVQVFVDVSKVPRTEEAQRNMRTDLERAEYDLANIFFLSLNMPDSARIYYESVVEQRLNDPLVPRALFSLSELELLQDNEARARQWARTLVDDYPTSVFARRSADRFGFDVSENTSIADPVISSIYNDRGRSPEAENPASVAEDLRHMTAYTDRPEQKALLLYEAAREYIKAGRSQQHDSLRTIENWNRVQQEWQQEQASFADLQSRAAEALQSDTLSDDRETHWQAIADSTLAEPPLADFFPYIGAEWDSARTLLTDIDTNYPRTPIRPQARILLASIDIPEFMMEEESPTAESPETVPLDDVLPEVAEESLMACIEQDPPRQIRGTMEEFVRSIAFPEWALDSGIQTEAVYRVTVLDDGTIADFELQSAMDRSGIPEAIEQAISRQLIFERAPGVGVTECTITIPIEL
ncbi:MAG: tetratricopeptide repeat protein [Balneolaceae bacterium]